MDTEDKVKHAKLVVRCLECVKTAPEDRTKKLMAPVLEFMKGIFKKFDLAEADKVELVRTMMLEAFNPGEYVMHMGDRGDKWYIVLQGALTVFVPNFQLQDLVQKANTAAAEECLETREKLIAQYKKDFGPSLRRNSNCSRPRLAGSMESATTLLQRRALIYFELLNHLQQATVDALPSFLEDINVPSMFNEELKAFVPANKDTESDWWTSVAVMKDKMAFGDLALIQDVPRTATIYCQERSLLLVVSKENYQVIKNGVPTKRLQERQAFFRGISAFRELSDPLMMYIASNLNNRQVERGAKICVKDQPLVEISLVRQGVCKVVAQQGESGVQIGTRKRSGRFQQLAVAILGPYSFISDLDALSGKRHHSTTVVAESTTVELFCMSAKRFISSLPRRLLDNLRTLSEQKISLRAKHQRCIDDAVNAMLPNTPESPREAKLHAFENFINLERIMKPSIQPLACRAAAFCNCMGGYDQDAQRTSGSVTERAMPLGCNVDSTRKGAPSCELPLASLRASDSAVLSTHGASTHRAHVLLRSARSIPSPFTAPTQPQSARRCFSGEPLIPPTQPQSIHRYLTGDDPSPRGEQPAGHHDSGISGASQPRLPPIADVSIGADRSPPLMVQPSVKKQGLSSNFVPTPPLILNLCTGSPMSKRLQPHAALKVHNNEAPLQRAKLLSPLKSQKPVENIMASVQRLPSTTMRSVQCDPEKVGSVSVVPTRERNLGSTMPLLPAKLPKWYIACRGPPAEIISSGSTITQSRE